MRERLKEALQEQYPAMRPKLIERYVGKYVTAVMHEIATQYMHMTTDDWHVGEMDFAADLVSNKCGRMDIDKCKHYIYQVMQQHPSTALVISAYVGNNITHRVSRVILNPKYKREIMDELRSLTIECNPDYLRELDDKANLSFAIDLDSLRSYITQTQQSLQNPPSEAYECKLMRNLQIAVQLVAMAKEKDGITYLNEYWEPIDSGRMHGHGLSLQRIPKEVRHAALGTCYRYDLKAASYALMTSLALAVDPTLKVGALKEYITYRSAIRKRIAAEIGISEDWMKGIFTAVGFGASLANNTHKEIRYKLGAEKFNKLLSNAEFMYINKALDAVSATVLQAVGKGDFEWFGMQYTAINPKDGKKRTANQQLAWMYQCMETDAMNTMTNMIPEGYNVLLPVHDCLYLDKPLPSAVVVDIKWKLRQHYELLDFEGDAITPIHASGYVGKREQEALLREREHRQAMEAEAERAETYIVSADTMLLIG